MNRQKTLQTVKDNPEVSVLIIGGGVNGIGAFRDLALQGVDALLVDRGDFCSGTSAGSSHMLHGGIRYLENGEFRLVNEALHERDRMLRNAPHYAKPLLTTIPIFRWFSGLLNAPLKFFNLLDRPGERGALVVKIGLTLYDWLLRGQAIMPKHEFRLRAAALHQYPQLNAEIVCAASYYDAWMPYPERICLEMLLDAEAYNTDCHAINYLSAVAGDAHSVTLGDELSGESLIVRPKVVINAAGPWIDFVNRRMGRDDRRLISGTKGSHLVLDHPDLLAATCESEIFFENDDGRIVLILPYLGRVMVGTTDIRIDDPDDAVISEAEIDYILNMVDKVFPAIRVDRSHIVFSFSAVRPLPFSEGGATGQISRDHSIETIPPDDNYRYPIHSLVGGKWTTFRAFSEQTTDRVLADLGLPRRASTQDLPIGGGRAYPRSEQERRHWLRELESRSELPIDRLRDLFERYGTRADEIAMFASASDKDRVLANHPGYSRREIEFILRHEKVTQLEDLVLRRTVIAMLGNLTRRLLDELADICAETLVWSDERKEKEVQRTLELLRSKHLIDLQRYIR
ncbi:MAG: glycerol-3-phosphate dehydrogenase/oxidase [Chloroflexi bacterium]|nr:glycerol-3-phosphate dehydrogenase/oxidase [Chloroflexota bacterium]